MKTYAAYKRLLGYVKPYRKMLILGILAGFLCGGSNIGVLTVIPKVFSALSASSAPEKAAGPPAGSLIDRMNPAGFVAKWMDVKEFDPEQQRMSLNFLLVVLGVFVVIVAFRAVMMVANRFFMRYVGLQVVRDIRNLIFGHLQRQSLSFYGTSDIGELVSRVNNDTGAIERSVSQTIADLTRAPMEILGVMVYLTIFTVSENVYFLWILLLVVGPLALFPIMYFSRKIRAHIHSSLESIAVLNSRMHEVFTGIRIVKAFDMGKEEEKRFAKVNNGYVRQLKKALRAELSIVVVLEVANVVLGCCVLVVCFMQGLTFDRLVVIGGAALLCYQPAKKLARVNTQIQRSMAAASRIFELLDRNVSLVEADSPKVITSFNDCIAFDHVSFHYNPEQSVLTDINLTIPKGRVVAFVGMAGSGKSTLANLVARFYDPIEGKVTIDGADIREISIGSLRDLVGVVTQDTILFNDTIANNITYGASEVDKQRMIDAAKRANAHDFIMEKEDGYDMVVGDKGFVLSGGQKQRLAIARALYKDPEILILDEATSSLDSMTEKLVQEALNELMKDRTVLAIAHRLSTIRHAYRICVIENGRIVEQGTHDELMALDGVYTLMNRIQALD